MQQALDQVVFNLAQITTIDVLLNRPTVGAIDDDDLHFDSPTRHDDLFALSLDQSSNLAGRRRQGIRFDL